MQRNPTVFNSTGVCTESIVSKAHLGPTLYIPESSETQEEGFRDSEEVAGRTLCP